MLEITNNKQESVMRNGITMLIAFCCAFLFDHMLVSPATWILSDSRT